MTFRKAPAFLLACALELSACAVLPKAVVHPDPLSADEHVHLGVTYEAQDQLANAQTQYEAAVHEDSHNAQAWMSLGNLAYNAGHWPDAERDFKRVLKLSPHDAAASNNLAMVYLAGGTHQDQIDGLIADALKQEGELRPYVLETQAKWQAKQGRLDEARKSIQDALLLVPPQNKALRDELEKSAASLNQTNSRGGSAGINLR